MIHSSVQTMLERYRCETQEQLVHALKEIMQEVALVGLWRSKFFEEAAFYGGTALRILFQLDRFSEDLDFSLLAPNPKFDLKEHLESVQRELDAMGFHMEVTKKAKVNESTIQSAFLKGNTMKHLLTIAAPHQFSGHRDELLKIKLEVDIDPPPEFTTDTHYLLQPVPCSIRVFSEPDLFAGKMHALLCRNWQSRIKGRDWYDLVWYVARRIPLHLHHLEKRMRQSGHHTGGPLMQQQVLTLLTDRINTLDLAQAKQDVQPFLSSSESLSLWSPQFFHSVAAAIQFT
jgi:predicted nucleotidyltransferase component of viral defense system